MADGVSDASSCSPVSLSNTSVARSPSAEVAETGTAHDSMATTQSSNGSGQTAGIFAQRVSIAQAGTRPPLTTPAESSRKRRSLHGGTMERDTDLGKRRRAIGNGDEDRQHGSSVGDRLQSPHTHQSHTGKSPVCSFNGSGSSASQGRESMHSAQGSVPSKVITAPQSVGSPPSGPSTAPTSPSHQETEVLCSPKPLIKGYSPLTMATPQRRFTEWEGEPL